jgi:hypothetical protein
LSEMVPDFDAEPPGSMILGVTVCGAEVADGIGGLGEGSGSRAPEEQRPRAGW